MRYILLLICSLFFVSCSSSPVSTACQVETYAANAIASSLATAMGCTNLNQIKSDLMSAMGKANVCSATSAKHRRAPKGPIGNIVCPLAVQASLQLAASKVPSSWGCSPDATVANLGSTLTMACEAVVPL